MTHKTKKNEGEVEQYFIPDHHPAIVEREVWDKAQVRLEQIAGKRRRIRLKQQRLIPLRKGVLLGFVPIRPTWKAVSFKRLETATEKVMALADAKPEQVHIEYESEECEMEILKGFEVINLKQPKDESIMTVTSNSLKFNKATAVGLNYGVDSLTRQEMDITPFKNILNDMYSRDISKKVLAGRMTRSRQGKFCGGQPPLGLMRDPEDRGHLILDPETAPVIRKIYDLALDGWGCMRIAKQLMEDKVPITRVNGNTACDVNYYAWGGARISHILRNPFYKGAHLVCRTHQKGIRSNTYDSIPREDWEIIEGCHEAIVTPEEWEQVQAIVDRRPPIMKGNACPFYNLFHGIIYCATCGKSMQVRYEKVGRTGKNRFTGEMREPIDKAYYICQTYNRLGKNACTSHKIEARDLYNLVLKDIQELAAMALKDASEMQKERERLEARNREIDDMFLSLYTDKAKGVISEQRFIKLTAAMDQEQEENQRRLQELLRMLQQSDAQESEVRTFIREIRQYATIQELDETVSNRLISRILVGEVKKVDGQKVQKVRIVYNFVGDVWNDTKISSCNVPTQA